MQIVPEAYFLWQIKKNNFNLLSAEFVKNIIKVKEIIQLTWNDHSCKNNFVDSY